MEALVHGHLYIALFIVFMHLFFKGRLAQLISVVHAVLSILVPSSLIPEEVGQG